MFTHKIVTRVHVHFKISSSLYSSRAYVVWSCSNEGALLSKAIKTVLGSIIKSLCLDMIADIEMVASIYVSLKIRLDCNSILLLSYGMPVKVLFTLRNACLINSKY